MDDSTLAEAGEFRAELDDVQGLVHIMKGAQSVIFSMPYDIWVNFIDSAARFRGHN